jgi:hypothetical protein
MNRRVAAVRGVFEYAVITGARTDNPGLPGRRSTELERLHEVDVVVVIHHSRGRNLRRLRAGASLTRR